MVVWVAGNAPRSIVRDLTTKIGADKGQTERRGIKVPRAQVPPLTP